jgi:hypothetical protein
MGCQTLSNMTFLVTDYDRLTVTNETIFRMSIPSRTFAIGILRLKGYNALLI